VVEANAVRHFPDWRVDRQGECGSASPWALGMPYLGSISACSSFGIFQGKKPP